VPTLVDHGAVGKREVELSCVFGALVGCLRQGPSREIKPLRTTPASLSAVACFVQSQFDPFFAVLLFLKMQFQFLRVFLVSFFVFVFERKEKKLGLDIATD
jgi:hypothetical protein